MDKPKYYVAQDKGSIILDIGIAYTKIGIVGKNTPTKILKTPQALFAKLKNIDVLAPPTHLNHTLKSQNQNKVVSSNQLSSHSLSSKDSLEMQLQQKPNEKYFAPYHQSLRLPLWDFLNQIFYHELLVKPSNRNVYICDNYMFPRIFTQILADILFENFNIQKVFFLLSNSLPLYLSEQNTGMIVECNYLDTQVTPIYEGFAQMNAYQQDPAGGYKINYTLKQEIMKRFTKKQDLNETETIEQIKKMPQYSVINKFLNFQCLEDVKFKYGKILSKKQKQEFFSTPENVNKMKETLMNFTVNKHQKIPITYFEVMNAMEVLFGDIENEETNVAYTFLKSVLKLENSIVKKTVQNVIFSGGITQIKGFASRFREEVIDFLDNCEEFAKIKFVKDHIRFTNIIYPGNTLNWVGASILGSMQGTEKFCVTLKQYQENDCQIPDRFGVAYLFANREAPFIAPEIEQADVL